MDAVGLFDLHYEEVEDLRRARRLPSLQLAGYADHSTLELNALSDAGAEIVGRFAGLRDGRAMFSGSLANVCALADLKLGRLLDTIDEWATEQGLNGEIEPAQRYERTRVSKAPRLEIDLRSGEFASVIWATGYRPDYSWLHAPVFDRKGLLQHDGGVVAPGALRNGPALHATAEVDPDRWLSATMPATLRTISSPVWVRRAA